MTVDLRCKAGLGLAIVGLLVSLLCLVPAVAHGQVLPWPLFAGSFVYLAGGLLLALNARGPVGKKYMIVLRVVRFGFVAIFLLMISQMGPHR